MLKVTEVTETKAFIKGWGWRDGGSPVCQGWQMPRRDWLVPARMGFAVNTSQLGQSDWKEMAQKGYFVSATVCEADAKTKHNCQFFRPSPLGCATFYGGKLTWDLNLPRHRFVSTLLPDGGAFNVAVDVNIAFCVAFVFVNSIQRPELLPDTNMSSQAFQIALKRDRNLSNRLQFSWKMESGRLRRRRPTDAESYLKNRTAG